MKFHLIVEIVSVISYSIIWTEERATFGNGKVLLRLDFYGVIFHVSIFLFSTRPLAGKSHRSAFFHGNDIQDIAITRNLLDLDLMLQCKDSYALHVKFLMRSFLSL